MNINNINPFGFDPIDQKSRDVLKEATEERNRQIISSTGEQAVKETKAVKDAMQILSDAGVLAYLHPYLLTGNDEK